MSVFISVVSHGHGELIKQLSCLPTLAREFVVVVKLNKEELALTSYLESKNINYIDEQYGAGFGHNNNIIYSYCEQKLGMKDGDFFLVLNPDVISTPESIYKLIECMERDEAKIASVNLFKDDDCKIPDNSIRKFPCLSDFVKSFLGFGNDTIIDKGNIKTSVNVDWAAGSFLMFKAQHYKRLRGFDEGYFMYCEDIDICYRSNLLGIPLMFYPEVVAKHLASHANRRFFSKHFFWHIKSVIRFLFSKLKLVKFKSVIK
ncbi:glycosyltransferase family 2 protein [Vibrio vulnificus]|nr:glycosyltransferase family 2 protein [Vibrio vulnificus]HAS6329553.1 glycosyltransferase family 2 protein [Vibrio vulnificus]HDY7567192.1 glycosyltransferase family 2 protein [Vibrio vulnificus]